MDNALLTLIVVLPFVLAVWMANAAERNSNLRILQYAYLLMINSLLFVVGLSSLVLGLRPEILATAGIGDTFKNIDWTMMGVVLMVGTVVA
ncbi:MAG TPA: hypothetical protein VGK81_05775, partial [Anaerolineae bacterium]